MEVLSDMTDSEKGGGIKVGQNLYQDFWWQPAEQVIKHHKKQQQLWYECLDDKTQRPAAAWCSHLADLACREKQISIGINLTLSLSNQIWKWRIFSFIIAAVWNWLRYADTPLHVGLYQVRVDSALNDFKEKVIN